MRSFSIEIHPHQHSASDKICLGHKSPVATVITVVAVVAHHEVLAFRHRKLTFGPHRAGTLKNIVHHARQIFLIFAGTHHAAIRTITGVNA